MKKYNRISLIIAFVAGMVITTVSAQQAKVLNLDKNVYAISLLGYTSLVVEGENDVLITDPANTHRATLLKKEIEKLTDKPIAKIVLTHEHFDHTGGSEVFTEARIIAQKNVMNLKRLDPLDMFPDKVDILFDQNLTLDMGTTTVELKYPGAGDGAAIALIYLPREKIAVTADMYVDQGLNPGIFLSHTNLLGTRHILNTLVSWNLNHAVNVHSSRTDTEPLERTAAFLNDLYSELLPKIQSLNSDDPHGLLPGIFKLKETLKMPKYKDWENYSDLPVYIQKMAFDIIHGG
ncbi:MBL fold metallo-hydrolase [Leptobacterium flavescens]|uniref:MBL fold metallo-hydrolase n=1 Tax=Leptobacterium flavescens TaxID=472055 RepID=A0A6P0USA6_9FLAO|nr:MBL fold metallo-hydrolase [Leptobacterium flavescens]NER15400.1 MBL fold metallo-hydrolase [Leptobacterium flavescens]